MNTTRRPNKFAGTCTTCKNTVDAGAGWLVGKTTANARWEIAHTDCNGSQGPTSASAAKYLIETIDIEVKAMIAVKSNTPANNPANDNWAEELMAIEENAFYFVLEARGMTYRSYANLVNSN